MTNLFKKVDDLTRRTIRYPILLNEQEDLAIKRAAKIRNLSVAEYFRRAALGRRADPRYDTEVILVLRDFVAGLRQLHADMVERGIQPPESAWEPAIDEAIAAMKRITK